MAARAAMLGLALLLAACAQEGDRAENAANAGQNVTANVATPIVENHAIDPAPDPVEPLPPTPRPVPPVRNDDDSYRAMGTEPFWNLTIRNGRATLSRPDKPPLPVGDLIRTDDARAIRYQGEGFTATITAGPCSDGMSDAIWSDRVQIAFAEGTLKGCGGKQEMPEDG